MIYIRKITMAIPLSLGVTLGLVDSDIWRDFKYLMTQYTIWDECLLEIDNLCKIDKTNTKTRILDEEKIEKLDKYFMKSEITNMKNIIFYRTNENKKEVLKLKLEKITEDDFSLFD